MGKNLLASDKGHRKRSNNKIRLFQFWLHRMNSVVDWTHLIYIIRDIFFSNIVVAEFSEFFTVYFQQRVSFLQISLRIEKQLSHATRDK